MDDIVSKDPAVKEFERWFSHTTGDKYHEKLVEIQDNEDEIQDAFSRTISFGTSGIRGIIGPGTNRINRFVVRRITQGIANYLKRTHKPCSIVIGYDSRRGSKFFAYEAASVLRGNLVKPYLFKDIVPSPVLSYATRKLGCDLGIMITASHNPKIYNGYKVFSPGGYQLTEGVSEEIMKEIEQLDYFGDDIKYESQSGIYQVPDDIEESFCDDALTVRHDIEEGLFDDFKVIYTPLHGAGLKCMENVFQKAGISYDLVPSQKDPDKEFRTCPVPNPEKIMAYDESFKYLDDNGGDIIIATDPDSDRVGCAIEHDGMRTVLTGNQTGILLLDYLCHIAPPGPGQIIVRSIASSPMSNKIAERYGLRVKTILTGFKYVGEMLEQMEKEGTLGNFYFAFEESSGYLVSPFVREKDGISTALLIAEMAAFHKKRGKNLIERLYELYNEYGIYVDKTRNYFLTGSSGEEIISGIMDFFRTDVNQSIGGRNIVSKKDYLSEEGFPKSNVLEFSLDDGSTLVIRPSGTEPVIKIYSFETCDFSEVDREISDIVDRYKSVINK